MNQKNFLWIFISCFMLLWGHAYAATTVSTTGVIAKSGTVFSSSVSEDDEDYQATLKVGTNKELIFKASMEIDSADVGKVADILLVIGVEPKAPFDGGVDTKYSAYTSTGKVVPVNLYATPDVWMAELTSPYRAKIKLGEVVSFVSLGKYKLTQAGMYYVFIGYRLISDGTVVYNDQPIIVDATNQTTTTTTPTEAAAPTNTVAGDATPTVTTKAAAATTEPTAYTGIVAAHNVWRKKVGVPDLVWSSTLAAVAQKWATTLKTTKNCSMVHSGNSKYGENLYWASGFVPTTKQVVDAWGNEVKDYTYVTNKCAAGKVCGHYTQVVWKDTTSVGCGKATCGTAQVWVCNYNPPGNWVGQKPY